MGAGAVLAGEGVSRLVRSRVLGMTAGQTLSLAAEGAIGFAGGLAAEKFVGRQFGRDFTVGALASVGRTLAKQLNIGIVNEALSDNAPGRRYVIRNGKVYAAPLNGYVGTGRLNGYVGRQALNGAYDEQSEIYGAN